MAENHPINVPDEHTEGKLAGTESKEVLVWAGDVREGTFGDSQKRSWESFVVSQIFLRAYCVPGTGAAQ